MNNWQKGCDMGFTVGQKAWHSRWGWGEIIGIMDGENYAVKWRRRRDGVFLCFMLDGCYHHEDISPSLFHKEQTFDYGKPEWQPKPGELCWVWNGGWGVPNVRIISEIDDGLYIAHVPASDIKMEYTYCAPFNNGQLPDEFKHLLEGGQK